MPVRRSSSRYFYLLMSLVMLAVVTYGFGRRLHANLMQSTNPHKTLVEVHGAIFYAWMLLFVAQSALVQARRVGLHRLLGWFAVADGVLVILSGAWITLTAPVPTNLFRLVGTVSVLGFAIPFALAIAWRRQPEAHRRLLLISTAVLTNAAFARFPDVFHPGQLFYAGTDLLILAGVAHDLLVQRRVHPVYRIAFPLLLVAEIAVMIPVWRYLS